MRENLSKLPSLRLFLLCCFPVALYFPYYPRFFLASTETMDLELSLPLILLLLFALLSLPSALRMVASFIKSFLAAPSLRSFAPLAFLLFPLYTVLSLLWTANLPRAILTAGIFGCILISVLSMLDLYRNHDLLKHKTTILKVYLWGTVAVCLFCWLQCALDLLALPREITPLCPGCVSATFGFPPPSGFAIEPQFMGNLLLLPSLLLIYFLLHPDQSLFAAKKSNYLILVALSSITLFTLFLTFSRGAIYSFLLALALLLIWEFIRQLRAKAPKTKSSSFLAPLLVTLFAFLFSLGAQGLMSALSPYDTTFVSGVSKSLSQLTLGKLDLSSTASSAENPAEISPDTSETPKQPLFSGYVEESTNTRVLLSSLALGAWTSSPSAFLFGFGLGSSGVTIHRFYPDIVDSKEIIQNEFFTLALELGLVGLLLLLLALTYLVRLIFSSNTAPLFASLAVAFVASLMFFSGLPNALHIYLLPPLFYLLSKNPPKPAQKQS